MIERLIDIVLFSFCGQNVTVQGRQLVAKVRTEVVRIGLNGTYIVTIFDQSAIPYCDFASDLVKFANMGLEL